MAERTPVGSAEPLSASEAAERQGGGGGLAEGVTRAEPERGSTLSPWSAAERGRAGVVYANRLKSALAQRCGRR